MLALLAAWSDKDVINALAAALALILPAVGYLIVRVWRQKSASDQVNADILERTENRTTAEQIRMLDAAMRRVDHLESEMIAQDRRHNDDLRERDKRYERLQSRIEACEAQRAAQAERLATQSDTIAWMKSMLRKAGLISDDDDTDAGRRTTTPQNVRIPNRPPATDGDTPT